MFDASDKLTFLLVGEYPIARMGLSLFIQEFYENATISTVATYEKIPAALLNNSFDIVILDIKFPVKVSFDWIAKIKILNPTCKILVFADLEDSRDALRYIFRGADGYMDKRYTSEQINIAIKSVVFTGRYFSKQLKALLREMYFKNEEDRGLLL